MRTLLQIFAVVLLILFAGSAITYQLPGQSDGTDSVDESEKHSPTLYPGRSRVWLKEGTSLNSTTPILLDRAVDGTNVLLAPTKLDEFTSMIHDGLKENGFVVVGSVHLGSRPSPIRMIPTIIRYDPGSAGARWLAPGLGATVCVIRATLVDPMSKDVVGEILSWRNLASGGFFTIGAHEYVPRHTAEDIGKALMKKLRDRQ